MKPCDVFKKYENHIIMLLTLIVNMVLMSMYFDFYYLINDDVMMKDIMSGAYTGTPDGHNVQTLYVLGAFISILYRLCGSLPWYSLFLLLCQAGSLYLIGVRLLRFCTKRVTKAGCLLLITVFIWGIILPYMIALHYSVTTAILAAAAIFLFITTEKGLTCKQFVIRNIPSVMLVILAYQLRTEMLLLVFPFICLAGFFRWVEEDKFFQKENYIKYGIVLGCILAGMLLSRLIDFAAYGSKEWKSYLVFFNKRTEVYDFHEAVLYNGDFLSSIGLGEAQHTLLRNYNFGLDEEINEQVMSEIAKYASSDTFNIMMGQLRENVYSYVHRTLFEEDVPYNKLILCGYLSVFLAGILSVFMDDVYKKKLAFLWELILLGIVRTIPWMYIIMRGRIPGRIIHSLYLVEAIFLMGMLCIQVIRIRRPEIFILIGLAGLWYLPRTVQKTFDAAAGQEYKNQGFYAVDEYCRAHPESYYFEDVYSIVDFSQKAFKNVDNSLTNYDFAGGWNCKSPLYREKLGQFGIATMEEGLLTKDYVYFITSVDESMDWMRSYYEEKGNDIVIEQVDLIGNSYAVYQVIQE